MTCLLLSTDKYDGEAHDNYSYSVAGWLALRYRMCIVRALTFGQNV
jgi:hypothetical protein